MEAEKNRLIEEFANPSMVNLRDFINTVNNGYEHGLLTELEANEIKELVAIYIMGEVT